MQIYPVVHHLDSATTLDQARCAFEAGADGIFLISHAGDDVALGTLALAIKVANPAKRIGLNFLRQGPLAAARVAADLGIDMIWGDQCGVSSAGLSSDGVALQSFVNTHPSIEVFASIAFKYQPHYPNPGLAASNALAAGFLPVTSGFATGCAPAVDKIARISSATSARLGIASGMTPENVRHYAPFVSHILVSTGVSRDEHHLDFETLCRFIALARR